MNLVKVAFWKQHLHLSIGTLKPRCKPITKVKPEPKFSDSLSPSGLSPKEQFSRL